MLGGDFRIRFEVCPAVPIVLRPTKLVPIGDHCERRMGLRNCGQREEIWAANFSIVSVF